MKRFWHSWFAMIAAAAMISPAFAQTDGMSTIGSYQSILNRAGYQTEGGAAQLPAAVNGSGQISGQVMQDAYANGQMSGAGNYAMPGSIPQGGMMQGGMMQGGMMQGGVVHGDMSQGGMVQGDMMQGGMVQGGMVQGDYGGGYVDGSMGGVIQTQGSMGAPMMSGPAMGGAIVADGGSVGGYVGGYNDCGVGYDAPVYSDSAIGGGSFASRVTGGGGGMFSKFQNLRQSESRNYVLGLGAVFFQRDYEDGKRLSVDGAGNGLFSDSADHGNMAGAEASLTKRGSRGVGWQMLYWGIPSEDVSVSSNVVPLTSQIRALDQVDYAGTDAYTIFNSGDVHTINRSTEINNFEFNFLRNAGCFGSIKSRRSGLYELVGGFRYFNFDEQFSYANTYTGNTPEQLSWNSNVENQLFGFQVGGRREYCLSNKMSIGLGSKVGIFNNRVDTRQFIQDGNGAYAQVTSSGRDVDYSDRKNDAAFLGELDAGVNYRISNNIRARIGYRALGVSGVALAADQLPRSFNDADRLSNAYTNGELMLHGAYFGIDFAR